MSTTKWAAPTAGAVDHLMISPSDHDTGGTAAGLIFADVAQSHWAAAWIERFPALGYTSGCSVSPLQFCPDDVVTRAGMAVFMQRVFNLVGSTNRYHRVISDGCPSQDPFR